MNAVAIAADVRGGRPWARDVRARTAAATAARETESNGRRTGTLEERRQMAWMKSMRGERKTNVGGWKVLDVVMIWSVSTAMLCFGVWFFFFAGSSI